MTGWGYFLYRKSALGEHLKQERPSDDVASQLLLVIILILVNEHH